MRRQWLDGREANREIRRGKEQYRRYLDCRQHRAEFVQTLRFFESLGKPLSSWERQVLAEEEGR